IIPCNRPSYPNHLSRVLVRMLVQLTEGYVNRLTACLRPTPSAATQGKNRGARPRQNELHFGGSCCCCCCFWWMYRVLDCCLSMLLDRYLGFVGFYPAFIPETECLACIV